MILVRIAVIIILSYFVIKIVKQHPILYIIFSVFGGAAIGAGIGSQFGLTVLGAIAGAAFIIMCLYIIIKSENQ